MEAVVTNGNATFFLEWGGAALSPAIGQAIVTGGA